LQAKGKIHDACGSALRSSHKRDKPPLQKLVKASPGKGWPSVAARNDACYQAPGLWSGAGPEGSAPQRLHKVRSSLEARDRCPGPARAQVTGGCSLAHESNSSDVGARYAQALFDLAVETGALDVVEAELEALSVMRRESADLRALLTSPAFSAEEKGQALAAIAARAAFTQTTRKFLGLLSVNRRLGALGAITAAFKRLAAERRGIVSAEVVTAIAMTTLQADALAHALRESLGREPRIETRIDPTILGGFRVKIGSRLYDASLKSKLDSLKFTLKRA